MAKPIFLIKVSDTLDPEKVDDVVSKMAVKFDDYHVLVVPSRINEPTFEVLNGENLDPITIEELKAKLNL